MGALGKRILLYGTALGAGGFLLLAGLPKEEFAESVEALEWAAQFEMRVRDFPAARRTAARILEKDPGSLLAHLIDAHAAERLGKVEEAAEAYRRVLPRCESEDQAAEVCIALAELEHRQGRLAEARGWLERADPYHPDIRAKKALVEGMVLQGEGETQKAAEQFLAAAGLAQGNKITFHEAVGRLEGLGFQEEAARAYEGAAGRGDLEAKIRFARLKFLAGDADRGVALLQEVAGASPRFLRNRLKIFRFLQ